jgi:hypothetical protein
MARKIQTLFIDDIDGGEAEGTVRFSLDGTEFEIDLNARHSGELRKALEMYILHGRKVGGAVRRGRGNRRGGAGSVDTARAREWARENGYDIKERGRIPANIVAEYEAARGA